MTATQLSQAPSGMPHRRRIRWLDAKEHITGYLFILPAVTIITMFGFFPIGYALYMSTYSWHVKKGPFIGLDNYSKAIGDWTGALLFVLGFALLLLAYLAWNGAFKARSDRGMILRLGAAFLLVGAWLAIPNGWDRMLESGDQSFLDSLPITLFYSLSTVPAELAVAMVLAYILFQKIRGQEFFRMLYFLPYITPVVASAVVFRTIFSPRDTSLANIFLSYFSISPQDWLFEPQPINEILFNVEGLQGFLAGPSMALVSIALFGVWTYVGYNTVIFLAGLGSIPNELYEAAEIDGAGKLQLFRNITLPLLSPVTFYLALIAFIGTFKAFNHIYVMRVPSAQGTVDVTSVAIFDTFYKLNQYGYAAAQAVLLFVIILFLTFVQNKVFGERVFYG
ncbi:MAG: sugar ABC transporter permease [Anaerolineales bacterium]|nr:sugar ABC transporter permease [Anaerolineales bacterium]